MHSILGVFSVFLFSIILLISASSFPFANAQEYDNDKYYYKDFNEKNNNYFFEDNKADYIDKDGTEYYYYIDKENNDFKKLVQECEDCFLEELYYQLSDKQRYFFFNAIEYEFGSLEKLCKLIVNEKISEQGLEDMLRHILLQIFDEVEYENNDKINTYYSSKYENKYGKKYYVYDDLYKLIPSQKIDNIINTIIECIFPPNVVITWNELDLPGGNTETFAAMSKDGGSTFGPPINVSETNTLSFNQQITMSGDNAVITWTERFFGGPDDEIFAAMSKDGGSIFGPPINVSETEASSFGSQITMSDYNVVIIWEEEFPGFTTEIFAAKSTDTGSTFESPINVSNTDTRSNFQQIAMSGDNTVITWIEVILPGSNSEIFAAKSTDTGSTFESPINVSNTDGFSGTPQIAMSYDNVVITWREILHGSNNEIFAAKSTDGGTAFEIPINVSNTNTSSLNPQIAMSYDNVVITWREILPGNNGEIFTAKSTDGGTAFESPINVSNTDTSSRNQQIAMSDDNVVITWQEDILGGSEIFAATSTDGGTTFGTAFNVSNTDASSSFPQIAMSDDIVVITWMDDVSGFNFEIFSAISTDGGSTFGTAFNVSNTDVDSTFPQVDIG